MSKELFKQLVKSGEINGVKDIEDILKNMFGKVLQEFLEAEMDDTLGYSKDDYKNKDTDNSRNGYSQKKVRTSMGEVNLSIPRDRKSEYEPRIVPKYSRELPSSIEDRILSMYASGVNTGQKQEDSSL